MTTETLPRTAPLEPGVVPLEPTTPIRPSEAIRLGCLTYPVQCVGEYFGSGFSACAVGAASEGWGVTVFEADRRFTEAVPDLPCPEPGCAEHVAYVPILNDNHRWSRERIADWLAGLGL